MRFVGRALVLMAVTTIVVPVSGALVVLSALLFLPLPASLPEARPGVEALISRIYDINGNEIGVFRQFDTTKPVQPGDIPEVLKQAVIAGEDRRFYSHSGVDVWGTVRALWADLESQEVVQGGSTITQQYVKSAYVGSERTLSRKLREAILASQLDRQVDKEEILFRYLERIYLGEGAYGVGAAAETYFHKPVNDLTLSEAAMLAGLIPAPSRYEPRGNPALAEEKRVIILDAMLEEAMITPDQHAEAVAQKLWVATSPEEAPPMPGATVVHPRERAETDYPFFVDYLQRYLAERYGEDAVYQRGLRIYTTLDPRMQVEAERSVGETLDGTDPLLEMSVVAVEPLTGFVKALVGGREFESLRVNLALGAAGGGSGRQPGSAFKPFVLAKALEEGISPQRTYPGGSPMEVAGTPFHNYGGSSYGRIDLRTATTKSVNTVYVQLLDDVGVPETMELARQMGVSTSEYQEGTHGLSIALGALDVSPLDMASSFGVFAARGERAEPTPVVRVLDADGQVLEDNAEPERSRVLEEITADNVNEILQGVLEPGGTAGDNSLDRPAAGKTGTAQDNGNAWFVGYTPTLSTSVWMGYSDAPRPLVGIKGVRAVTGGSLPASTWQSFMRGALADVPVTEFTEPAPITDLADILRRRARDGFDVRQVKAAVETEPGSYVEDLPPPAVDLPPPPTTTSTTAPRRGAGGGDPSSPFGSLFPPADRDDADRDDADEAPERPPRSTTTTTRRAQR